MTDDMAQSAIAGMRALTSHLDQHVEALMEAHGFSFSGLNATNSEAHALFICGNPEETAPWALTLRHSATGDMTVSLEKATGLRQQISLSILIGTDGSRTLAEGVGLAVSFAAISDQLKETP
jgi:hypothetical protein